MLNLDEFREEESNRLNAFTRYWKENNKKDPEAFPMNLDLIDWFEQLIMFSDNENKEV